MDSEQGMAYSAAAEVAPALARAVLRACGSAAGASQAGAGPPPGGDAGSCSSGGGAGGGGSGQQAARRGAGGCSLSLADSGALAALSSLLSLARGHTKLVEIAIQRYAEADGARYTTGAALAASYNALCVNTQETRHPHACLLQCTFLHGTCSSSRGL